MGETAAETPPPAAPPGGVKPIGQGQPGDIITHDEIVRQLARVFTQEALALLQPEIREAVQRAKSEMQRRDSFLNMGLDPDGGPRMSKMQRAEYFRCAFLGLRGIQSQPDKKLDADGIITQALVSGTGSAGGYLIPTDQQMDIEKAAEKGDHVWKLLTKRQTNAEAVTKPERTGRPTIYKGADAKSKSATDTDTITKSKPTYTQMTWTMRSMDCLVPVKLDLLAQSPVSVYDEVVDAAGFEFRYYRQYLPLLGGGSGDSEPLGLLDSDSAITEVAFGGEATMANFFTFAANLPEEYYEGAVALFHRSALWHLLTDLAAKVYSAAFLTPIMPTMDYSAHMPSTKVLLGNYRYYVVYWQMLMQIVAGIVPERFAQDIAIVEKWDGHVTIADAFRIGTGVTY